VLLPIALIIFGSNATPMTVTTVRKIPSELPHAHLYLEDVEEICKILLDAFSRPSTSQPTILFSIGDDLQMDSIDDLERRGGPAKDFSIEVGGARWKPRTSTLSIDCSYVTWNAIAAQQTELSPGKISELLEYRSMLVPILRIIVLLPQQL